MKFDVSLRSLKIEDAELINQLRSIESMEKNLCGASKFVSLDREREWVKSLIMNDNQSQMYFAISIKDETIGYTSISNIDYRNGTCFWSGIKLLPIMLGMGYGFQVELLVLRYIFEELRMQCCTAEGLEEYQLALDYMRKAGFKKEGLMRNRVFKNGEYKNIWLLSILSNEYLETKAKYEL
jgi:[ribosomal protein S5]-alanine N-acetyltransferase